MRVAIYIRIARLDVDPAADHQRAELHRLAVEQRWHPVGDYADLGQPGSGLDRPGLAALLDRIDQCQDVDAVAVKDLYRLTRDPAALLGLHLMLADRKVRIVTPTRPDGHNPNAAACSRDWSYPWRSARPHPPLAGHLREQRP